MISECPKDREEDDLTRLCELRYIQYNEIEHYVPIRITKLVYLNGQNTEIDIVYRCAFML